MYYWRLCEVFYQFRTNNNLSPAELCAFLYDFAPNFISKENTEIPKPSQAWCICGLIDPAEVYDITFGKLTQRQKRVISLFTTRHHQSAQLLCIWIAQADGVIDPFFHYYSNTYIGDKIDIPRITLKELQTDKYFFKAPPCQKEIPRCERMANE